MVRDHVLMTIPVVDGGREVAFQVRVTSLRIGPFVGAGVGMRMRSRVAEIRHETIGKRIVEVRLEQEGSRSIRKR
jgi:hypothetical protein